MAPSRRRRLDRRAAGVRVIRDRGETPDMQNAQAIAGAFSTIFSSPNELQLAYQLKEPTYDFN